MRDLDDAEPGLFRSKLADASQQRQLNSVSLARSAATASWTASTRSAAPSASSCR
jgi:hypothetical protein